MKPHPLVLLLSVLAVFARPASTVAHDLTATGEPGHYDFSVTPPGAEGVPVQFLLHTDPETAKLVLAASIAANRPTQTTAFEKFAPAVAVRWDERFLYVESNGLPAHKMMVGITAWQQQVPLPQKYTGANAWRI